MDAPTPSWLPELMVRSACQSEDEYLADIYYKFKNDFIDSHPTFTGKPVVPEDSGAVDGIEGGLWHVISEKPAGKKKVAARKRTIAMARCERIAWIRPIIEAVATGGLRWWKVIRDGEWHTVISLKDFSYIVVLKERPPYMVLCTAYPAYNRHQQDTWRTEHQEYMRTQKEQTPLTTKG